MLVLETDRPLKAKHLQSKHSDKLMRKGQGESKMEESNF